MGVDVRLEWSPEFKQKMDRDFSDGGTLQQWVDAMILESIEPYVPHDTGTLYRSGLINTRIGSGELVWKTPYAQYLYHGLLMVDPETGSAWARKGVKKVLAEPEKPLKFRGGGKHGSHWCEKWTADNLKLFEGRLQGKANELMKKGR